MMELSIFVGQTKVIHGFQKKILKNWKIGKFLNVGKVFQ